MDHGRDAPDQHCDKNGSTFCDLSHQIGRKGTAGLFLLVNDRLRFTCYAASRTMTGVCRPPLETGGLRTLAPLPGGQRPSAHAGVGRRRAGRRGAPLRGGCRDARTHPRRPSARPPGSQPRRSPPPASSCAGSPSPPGPPPVPSCGRAASVSRRSGGRPGAGAVERGRNLCRTVRAARACAGGRCRRAQRVDTWRTPSRRHPLQRHRARARDVRGRTSQHPPAAARRAGARAGRGSRGHGKAGAERCGSLTAGLRGDVTLEIALEPSGRARRSARHVARLLQWQLRRTSRSRLLPEREAQVADRRWMRWSVDGAAIR